MSNLIEIIKSDVTIDADYFIRVVTDQRVTIEITTADSSEVSKEALRLFQEYDAKEIVCC